MINVVNAPIDELDVSPEEELAVVSTAFAALGSEVRLAIVMRLVRAEPNGMATGKLGDAVGLSGSVLTHHLKHLKVAGLVFEERRGRQIILHADTKLIADLSDFMLAECCLDQSVERLHG
ncbi:ArsR/SmtB family transcription factor [Gymnodinialimonas hymeniacidonis]|uniref:ArsR/SmtB family transcription factor n=1 Tax=Gymnodinialimonas hymeniacidonis TaxID=3126508 RepID=UPI0034C5EB71